MDGPAPIRPQFVVDEPSLCAEIRRIRDLEGELGFKRMYSRISDKWPLARQAQVKKCMKEMGMLRAGPTQKQAPPPGSWLGKRTAEEGEDDQGDGSRDHRDDEVTEIQEQPPLPESKKAKRFAQQQQLLASGANSMPCYPPLDPNAAAYPPLPPTMPVYPPSLPPVQGVNPFPNAFNAYPNATASPLTPSLYPYGTPTLFRPPAWSLAQTGASLPVTLPPALSTNGLPNATSVAYPNLRPSLPSLSTAVQPPLGLPPMRPLTPGLSLPIQQLQQQIHLQKLQLQQQMRPPLPIPMRPPVPTPVAARPPPVSR